MTPALRPPSAIAFDLFGTVIDMTGVPRSEIVAYIDHIERPKWSPLTLPLPWRDLRTYPDVRAGVGRLRSKFTVVTCSNAPLYLQRRLLEHNGIEGVTVVPLEANQVYKPDPRAYETVCEVMGVEPEQVLIVTGNPRLGRRDFGDVEAARKVGMQAVLIRNPGGPQTILELADSLGC